MVECAKEWGDEVDLRCRKCIKKVKRLPVVVVRLLQTSSRMIVTRTPQIKIVPHKLQQFNTHCLLLLPSFLANTSIPISSRIHRHSIRLFSRSSISILTLTLVPTSHHITSPSSPSLPSCLCYIASQCSSDNIPHPSMS